MSSSDTEDTPINTYTKDPDSTLNYSIDWSSWLDSGETIDSSTWIVPAGLTEGSGAYASTSGSASTTIWLSGGTSGVDYRVTNRITTDATPPKIDDRTILIKVRER